MKTKLFSTFDPVSSKAFKQKIQYDLKGADYNETLLWNSDEGINVKPFYHQDEVLNVLDVITPDYWCIAAPIFILDAKQAAQTAKKVIKNGAEALYFTSESVFNVTELFSHLENNTIPVYIKLHFLDEKFYEEVYAFAKAYNIIIHLDVIGHLVRDGNWFKNLKEDYLQLTGILKRGHKKITIDTTIYQNAGAIMVQQLSYGLAHLVEYLHHCSQEKLTLDTVVFEVAVGTNYFFEIAKLRALRVVAQTLLEEFTEVSSSTKIKIIAHPTKRNKTIYDYNTNMLRTTTEYMSAVLGGADWVVPLAYDALYHKTNDFGERIARNQLIILKEESYFDAVQNASEGSYYIESLTEQLAVKALDLFKEIEKNGGFLKQLKEGTIQRKIKESASSEQAQFDEAKIILLGTNKHPNKEDRMKNDLELYPFLKIKPRKTLIEPIVSKRLSETMEQQRLKTEHND